MPLLRTRKSKMLVLALIAILAVAILAGYLDLLVNGLFKGITQIQHLPPPVISGYINYQDALSYNQGTEMFPYVSLVYNTVNASALYLNASIYKNPLPTRLYILNFTNDCYSLASTSCTSTNTTVAENSLINGIKSYQMYGLYNNLTIVSLDNVDSVKNNSILVVLNGLLPSKFYDTIKGNTTVIQDLLNRHVSIVYVGLNFSDMLISSVVPYATTTSAPEPYLKTISVNYHTYNSIFYANESTFGIVNGTRFGPISYKNIANGSIVAFPNTVNSWPSGEDAGHDVAKAIWLMFWLPRYDSGSTIIQNIRSNSDGSAGVIMDDQPLTYNTSLVTDFDKGYMRIIVQANSIFLGAPNAYSYFETVPRISSRGLVITQPYVIANATNVRYEFNVTYPFSGKKGNISTGLFFYNQNLVPQISMLGPDMQIINNRATPVISYMDVGLGEGNYIVMLRNFTDNNELAAGFFTIPAYNVTAISYNFTGQTYIFKVYDGKVPLQNIAYTVSINNLYPTNGVIESGVIIYKLPQGTPQIDGVLNFSFTILGKTVYYDKYSHTVLPFTVNSEYVEVGLVLAMMIIMVIFVRAPERDEFYIDVPNLPENKKIDVRVKADEVVTVFDKLNANYHWKYMPLSKAEVKSAIALNVKANKIPLELTFRNVDAILDAMTVNKYIAGADDLYAPVAWTEQSGHDITYLATFKKLRIYFVTHSYTFTDIGASDDADIVATLRGEKKYIVIYSQTSKFKKVPVYPDARTYLVFLNTNMMEDFKFKLYNSVSDGAEKLKMYISADYVRLVDADNIDKEIG